MVEVVQEQTGLLLTDIKPGYIVLQANGEVRGARNSKEGSTQCQGCSQDDTLELHLV
jgi:hypothetical protein